MTNRKLHIRFRLARRSMTLDDLELENNLFSSFRRQYFANSTYRCRAFTFALARLSYTGWQSDHRLRGSVSTVVTMTSKDCKVNGKREILTPCRSETPENIEAKLGVIDTWNNTGTRCTGQQCKPKKRAAIVVYRLVWSAYSVRWPCINYSHTDKNMTMTDL